MEDYSIIFTSGATGALKLVGENFNWQRGSRFYYLRINHNSVLGIREYALLHGANFLAVSEAQVDSILAQRKARGAPAATRAALPKCLFAFPAKDNFAGLFYPMQWIEDIQTYGLTDDCQWEVLLDAAAYVPTKSISLRRHQVAFMAVSFYKMFGYPTGLGALVMRKDASSSFFKVYWGGGTVVQAVCDSRWCRMKDSPSARFEDGTVSFLAIAALKYGLRALNAVGMDAISLHVSILTQYTTIEMDLLHHFNGNPVTERYARNRTAAIGGIVAFNILDPHGSYVNFAEVSSQKKAKKQTINQRKKQKTAADANDASGFAFFPSLLAGLACSFVAGGLTP
eukprot:GHVT01019151.1.p1 GENE.GHVT01019151.1~~GHVT01019151.1.p1  ORF type:complete len:381 (+),score=88.54 GHVT01019151.1:124-1143(+)